MKKIDELYKEVYGFAYMSIVSMLLFIVGLVVSVFVDPSYMTGSVSQFCLWLTTYVAGQVGLVWSLRNVVKMIMILIKISLNQD